MLNLYLTGTIFFYNDYKNSIYTTATKVFIDIVGITFTVRVTSLFIPIFPYLYIYNIHTNIDTNIYIINTRVLKCTRNKYL